jgi:hypothetical protein
MQQRKERIMRGLLKVLVAIVVLVLVVFVGLPLLAQFSSPPRIVMPTPRGGNEAATEVATTGIPKDPAHVWQIPSVAIVCNPEKSPELCKSFLVTEGAVIYNRSVVVDQVVQTQFLNTYDVAFKGASVDIHLIPGILIYDAASKQYNFTFEKRGNDLVMRFTTPVAMFRAYADNRRYSDTQGNWVNVVNHRINGHKDTALLNALSQQIDRDAHNLACATTDPGTGVQLVDSSGRPYLENAKEIFTESLVGILTTRWTQEAKPDHIIIEFPRSPCYLLPDVQRPAGIPGGPPQP